jgi:hypothetical protein
MDMQHERAESRSAKEVRLQQCSLFPSLNDESVVLPRALGSSVMWQETEERGEDGGGGGLAGSRAREGRGRSRPTGSASPPAEWSPEEVKAEEASASMSACAMLPSKPGSAAEAKQGWSCRHEWRR